MSPLDIKYFVNNAIFGHMTLITFYAECYKELICIKNYDNSILKNGDDLQVSVQIPYGVKYEKEYILKTLSNYMAPEAFVPIMVNIFYSSFPFFSIFINTQ